MDIAERYVRLCLRMGRHRDGFVDAYFGPREWARSIEAEEPEEPAALVREARSLLGQLEGSRFEDDRRRWLAAQLRAVECVAELVSGKDIAWSDEVERTLGVRPSRTDEGVLEQAHARLDAALGGPGSLRRRYLAWDEGNALPRDRLLPALDRLRDVLRPRAFELAGLPARESVTFELVDDVPWIAFAHYEGDLHTRIEVNAALPVSVVLLVSLAAHESYPGHHTERAAKDARLRRALRRAETSIAIAAAPEALISEGIGTNALEQALGATPFAVVGEALDDLGVRFDPAEAHEIHVAERALYAAGVNAAFMLHEDGATAEDAEAYLREWALESDERAARSVSFLTDPASRAYVSAYTDGRDLVRSFAERAPGNFSRLLTEQLTVTDLTA